MSFGIEDCSFQFFSRGLPDPGTPLDIAWISRRGQLPVGVRDRKIRTDAPRESCGPAHNSVACRPQSCRAEDILDWTRRHRGTELGAYDHRTVRTTDQFGRDGWPEQAVQRSQTSPTDHDRVSIDLESDSRNHVFRFARLVDVLPDIRRKHSITAPLRAVRVHRDEICFELVREPGRILNDGAGPLAEACQLLPPANFAGRRSIASTQGLRWNQSFR
jgi:hypothetical protein